MRQLRAISAKLSVVLFVIGLAAACPCEMDIPASWQALGPTLVAELDSHNMPQQELEKILDLMRDIPSDSIALQSLQNHMPRTTVALLRRVANKKLAIVKAEDIAAEFNVKVKTIKAKQLSNYDIMNAKSYN